VKRQQVRHKNGRMVELRQGDGLTEWVDVMGNVWAQNDRREWQCVEPIPGLTVACLVSEFQIRCGERDENIAVHQRRAFYAGFHAALLTFGQLTDSGRPTDEVDAILENRQSEGMQFLADMEAGLL
jgi:hypothetical protein